MFFLPLPDANLIKELAHNLQSVATLRNRWGVRGRQLQLTCEADNSLLLYITSAVMGPLLFVKGPCFVLFCFFFRFDISIFNERWSKLSVLSTCIYLSERILKCELPTISRKFVDFCQNISLCLIF